MSATAVAPTIRQSSLKGWAESTRPVRNSATPAAAWPISCSDALATGSIGNLARSEQATPRSGATTTGLVASARRKERTTRRIAGRISGTLSALSLDHHERQRRDEDRAGSERHRDRHGTALHPTTEPTIGRPTPARLGKATVSACSATHPAWSP